METDTDKQQAEAEVTWLSSRQLGARTLDGPYAGIVWALSGWRKIGDRIQIEFYPGDQFACPVDGSDLARA